MKEKWTFRSERDLSGQRSLGVTRRDKRREKERDIRGDKGL